MHPNEPQLVFRSDAGNYLPTKAYAGYYEAASTLGLTHQQALQEQVVRQAALLG